jgi:hypothetical protein
LLAVFGKGDHLVDDIGVHGAGDHRDALRVAGGGLGVLTGQVAVLTRPGPDPRVLQVGRAGQVPQLGERNMSDNLRIRASPVRD